MKYVIRDREAGNEIEEFETREEAEKALARYEAQDKADEIFSEDFYEIVEKKTIYDLTINTQNHVATWYDGFHKKCDNLGLKGFDRENYVIIEFRNCKYRISKYDLNKPAMVAFLNKLEKNETR